MFVDSRAFFLVIDVKHFNWTLYSTVIFILFLIMFRERLLQDQLRREQESVSNMQKLHERAQSQLFELRAQSGEFASF